MPGLVGVITKRPSQWAHAKLGCMVSSLLHEASYKTGTWSNEALGLYVGWVARGGSFGDNMPVVNEHEDVVLFFSGEEFPDPQTLLDLKKRGHILADHPASYLPHLYEESTEFPAMLNGRFHGLVADMSRETATLFVDRYGGNRLYYHESDDAIYFASEAKAILKLHPTLRNIDTRGLGEFISCGCVLENRTLFRGIDVLPPASAWTFQNGVIREKRTYFQQAQWEDQGSLDADSYYEELRAAFAHIVPRYFKGREKIGISLTGGLDTRMILAWWKGSQGSLPCYTFGSMYHESQDVLIAKKIAQLYGQTHRVITANDQFLRAFAHFAEKTVYVTDGCADVSRSPVLYANERAAETAPVRMTGNYGSEILRRMVAFKPSEPMPGLYDSELLPYIRSTRKTYSNALVGRPISFIAFRQVPWHHWALIALEQVSISPRSPFLDNEIVKLAYRAPKSTIVTSSIFAHNDECIRLIGDGNVALSKVRTDRGILGSGNELYRLLIRVLLEVSFKAEYESDYGMPQWLARLNYVGSALGLDKLFLGRHKYYHFRCWYKEKLDKYVRDLLLDSKTLSRSHACRGVVRSIVDRHLRGTHNYTSEIHKLITLELIYRTLIEANGPGSAGGGE